MAESMGVGLERWRRMLAELRTVGLLSCSSRNGEDGAALPEFPARPDSRPDRMCAREQLRDALSSAMQALPDRYRTVVLLYYTNDLTMKEIGDVLGVNESRVSQIHKTALEKMASALHSSGIHSSAAFC
jgi:RNA polymerase sigma factor FliA